MKYKGKKLEGRNVDVLVLMRGDDRIVFKMQAVESYEEFDNFVSIPEPPVKLKPGGVKEKDLRNSGFLKELEEYAEKKTDWLILTSLKVSEDIEWETIDYTDPNTWANWKEELKESGFIEIELMRIVSKVSEVNSLDDDMLEQARQDFLREASQEEKSSSQKGEPPST